MMNLAIGILVLGAAFGLAELAEFASNKLIHAVSGK